MLRMFIQMGTNIRNVFQSLFAFNRFFLLNYLSDESVAEPYSVTGME